jgi:phage N-6-adenine-methyltransferase
MADGEITRTGPGISRGASKQDYGTPLAFLEAVVKRFGVIKADLAASHENRVVTDFYGESEAGGSLVQPWAKDHTTGNLWLNPPYGDIAKWAEKCRKESKLRCGLILLLVPASIGAKWFADDVKSHAMVLALTPRLTFAGCTTPYPKDCILAVYGYGFRGFDVWDWRPSRYAADTPRQRPDQ